MFGRYYRYASKISASIRCPCSVRCTPSVVMFCTPSLATAASNRSCTEMQEILAVGNSACICAARVRSSWQSAFSRGCQVTSSSGTEKRNGSITTIRQHPEAMSPRSSVSNASNASASTEAATASAFPCAIISPTSLIPPSRKTVSKCCPLHIRCHLRQIRGSVKPSTPPLMREKSL